MGGLGCGTERRRSWEGICESVTPQQPWAHMSPAGTSWSPHLPHGSCRAGPALGSGAQAGDSQCHSRGSLAEEAGFWSPVGGVVGDFQPGTSVREGARWLWKVGPLSSESPRSSERETLPQYLGSLAVPCGDPATPGSPREGRGQGLPSPAPHTAGRCPSVTGHFVCQLCPGAPRLNSVSGGV